MKFVDWLWEHYKMDLYHFITRTEYSFRARIRKEYLRGSKRGL